jgi:hypothetical protein
MIQPDNFQWLVDNESRLPQIIAENSKYNRTPESQAIYNEYLKSNTQDEIIANIRAEMQGKVIDILPNKYGYDLFLAKLPNVKHYCLWVAPETPEWVEGLIIWSYIKSTFAGYPFVFFQNLSQAKSVPSFEHYHIFVNFE